MISVIIPTLNSAKITIENVTRIQNSCQQEIDIEFIIVDDGSEEEEFKKLKAIEGTNITIIRHPFNRGRANACNSGAEVAQGKYLLFVDCDCYPKTETFIKAHIDTINRGADVSLGPIWPRGNEFWQRYQHKAMKKRIKAITSGKKYFMTSANFMIKSIWFNKVGGFDKRYQGYGFEDRDLLLRLIKEGAIMKYSPDAAVYHDAELSLTTIFRKMKEAGTTTAPLFRQHHPEAYRELGYRAIDSMERPWLTPLALILGPLAERLVPLADGLLKRLPFGFAALMVKGVSATAFMYGTAKR